MTNYRVVKIPKKRGKFRTIYIPNKYYKKELRRLLTTKFFNKTFPNYVTGFVHNNNIVTNAKQHIGYKYTLSMDLQDFFDTVKTEYFNTYSSKHRDLISPCFIEGRLRQGLPTSPFLSNLAGLKMDEAILRLIRKNYPDASIVYTRYADDLAFSFYQHDYYYFLKNRLPIIINNCGFKINPKKTRLQDSRYGYRRICGINVGPTDIKIPKQIKSKLRALSYLSNKTKNTHIIHSYSGLQEYAKLKPPNKNREKIREAQSILKFFGFTSIAKRLRVVKKAIPEQKVANVVITNDPVYFVGMSLYTTNWSTCMNLRHTRACRKGVWVWNNLEGVSLAYTPSTEDAIIGGVVRKKMKNRCLVFETEDGCRYYGSMYPYSGELPEALEEIGFKNVGYGRGKKVKGRLPQKGNLPWQDNTKLITVKVKEKKYYRFKLA